MAAASTYSGWSSGQAPASQVAIRLGTALPSETSSNPTGSGSIANPSSGSSASSR